jgi:RNA polymerase sigma factor (sigma-70 family)
MLNWVEALRQDENKALKDIYRLYRSDCLAWLQNQFGLNIEEAIDVFQLAVIIIYDNAVQGKVTANHSDVKAYLYGVAKNKAYETLRQKKSHASLDDHSLLTTYLSNDGSEASDDYALDMANVALTHLGQPCQSILELYYYQNKSMDEITIIHGYKNSDTTKNQKYKCLKRLQVIYFDHVNKTSALAK